MGNLNSTCIVFLDPEIDDNSINKNKYKKDEKHNKEELCIFVFYENSYYNIKIEEENQKDEDNKKYNKIRFTKKGIEAYFRQLYISKNGVFEKDFKICLYYNNKKTISRIIKSYSNLDFNNKQIEIFNKAVEDYLLILEDLQKNNYKEN